MNRTEPKRLKVLISAYACEPYRGSEPGVGWNWSMQAAQDHDVWVLTWTKFKEPIERYMREFPNPNLHFVYYELPRWALRLAISERLHYMIWQAFVLPLARSLNRREHFDVVHHTTFNSVEVPGMLFSLGVPFVWGPVGGGQVPPAAMKSYFKSIWLAEMARGLRKRLLRFNPLVRLAANGAACVLVSNQDTMRLMKPLAKAPLVEELEIAIDLPEAIEPAADDCVLTILWAGRFIPRKGPLFALDIVAELKKRGVPFRLLMAGDGPWEDLAAEHIESLGLSGEVERLGLLTHAQMPGFYAQGDVFLFSSLQDTSGNVVLEAMANGMPVVSLDQHGAASLLTPECGIKVPVQNKSQVIRDMASALEFLARDPERRVNLGRAARERAASRFSWESKRKLLVNLYAQAAGSKRVDTLTEAPAARELVGASRGDS